MGIAGDGGVPVSGPECRPQRFGLESVAQVVPEGDDEFTKGIEWDELPCDYDLGVVSGQCPALPEQLKLSARGFATKYADAFAVYAGWKCATGGLELDRAWDNADELLRRRWWKAIERTLWTGLDQDGNVVRQTLATLDEDTGVALAADITPPTGAVDVSSGIAMLESFFGDCSECEPVVHANRGIAVHIAERGLVTADGAQQRITGTGSLLSAGAGYPITGPVLVDGGNPDVPADGEAWIYISGGITVTSGPQFFTPERGDLAGAVNRLVNDIEVFSERFATLQVGCCVGAVRVLLTSCCC